MSLNFSALHLVIGHESPSADKLASIFVDREDNYSSNNTHYQIEKKNLNDDYFWLYARYGETLPRSDTVLNTESQKEESNPRNVNQAELNKQLFFLYCIKSSTLYLWNINKRSWVEKYLQARLNQKVVIKNFITDLDEFNRRIKIIKKIKFVAKSNLFTSAGSVMEILPNPEDLFGLGVPEKLLIQADFGNAKLTPSFIERLGKMVNWKDKCEADSLLCVGLDDKNFEMVFNAESFIQKINVDVKKGKQELYDPIVVQQALIEKLQEF